LNLFEIFVVVSGKIVKAKLRKSMFCRGKQWGIIIIIFAPAVEKVSSDE
jgi:hypothetical protein